MGILPDQLFAADFTLEELGIIRDGAERRQDQWVELGLFIAWHIAMWSRVKTLPSWTEVERRAQRSRTMAPKTTPPSGEKAPKQTWQDMKAMLRGITTAMQSQPEKPARKGRRTKA